MSRFEGSIASNLIMMYPLLLIVLGVVVLVRHATWRRQPQGQIIGYLPKPIWQGNAGAFIILLFGPAYLQYMFLLVSTRIIPGFNSGSEMTWLTVLTGSTTLALATFVSFFLAYKIDKASQEEKLPEPVSDVVEKCEQYDGTSLLNFSPRPKPFLRAFAIACCGLLCCFPVLFVTGHIWQSFLTVLHDLGAPISLDPQDVVTLFREQESITVLLIMLITAVIVAPLAEEYLYRGGIQRFLRGKMGFITATLISSFVFAAIHFNLFSFGPLFILAIGMAYAYEISGDIKVPIIMHALFNLNTIVVILLLK